MSGDQQNKKSIDKETTKDENEVEEPPKRVKSLVGRDFGKKWYHFTVLSSKCAILLGSYAMTHLRFKPRSRGNQGSACCVVSIVFGRLLEPRSWTKVTLDEVLQYGDKLFSISATRNRVRPGVYMSVNLVYPEFFVGDYKCTICAEEGTVRGNLISDAVGCPEFGEGLERFFKVNDSGIITAQGCCVAVWRCPGIGFFYFDPLPRSEDGTKCFSSGSGVACLLRFKCLENARDHFLGNVDRKRDSRYSIANATVLKVAPIRRSPFDPTTSVCRSTGTRESGPGTSLVVVNKRTLASLNPLEVEEGERNCPPRKGPKRSPVELKLNKEPLSITISNYSIDAGFAAQPLVDQNNFDTGYQYYDMEVNVPSTFKELPGNLAILHGWTHEGSEVYKGKGGQNVANCVMAIALKKVLPVRAWLRPKLDEILALGDQVYAEVKTLKPTLKRMTGKDLDDARVKIQERKLAVNVDLMTVVGTLSSKSPSVLNLKRGLEEFFLVNTDGILECGSMAVAVWTQDDRYYTFDPRQCGPSGLRVAEERGKVRGKSSKAGKAGGDGGEKRVKGKCCVVRYPDLDSLVGLFGKNVEASQKNGWFTLRNASVVDDVPGTRAWHSFGPGEPGKWVLRGSTSNEDEDFEEDSRGLQGPSIPVVALVNARDIPPRNWTRDTLDETIRQGDGYFNWSRKMWSPEDEERRIQVTDLRTDFYSKDRKVEVSIEDSTVVGRLGASADDEHPNLERGIVQFFAEHRYGIVQIGDLWVAVWRDEEESKDKTKETSYYYMDPNPRGRLGRRDPEEDEELVSCVLRTLDPAQLAEFIRANVDTEDEDYTEEFAVHDLKVIGVSEPMSAEELEREMNSPLRPELNRFQAVGEDAALQGGSFNQGDEVVFGIRTRKKQQAANALVALAMTKLYSPFLWYREVVDEILEVGDKITSENMDNLPDPEEGQRKRDYLLPSEIDEEFNIGVNRISVELEEDVATGSHAELTGTLETFFEENTRGVFHSGSVIVPVWKEGAVFFTMDPEGRDDQGVPKDDGTAVVMWFLNIAALAENLRARIGATETADPTFGIDSVNVESVYETRVPEGDRPQAALPTEETWFHFRKISEDVWELSGDVAPSDERFPEENRDNQSAAVAVMAIVFSKVYEPRYWKTEVVNEVVVTGDKLYSKCIERLGRGSFELRANEVFTEFFLSNRRIDLAIRDCVQSGDLIGRPPNIQDLRTALDKFFETNYSGVLVTLDTNIAIWKFDGFYYAFVPGSSVGEDRSDAPRILRFTETRLMAENLLSALNSEGDFEICGIDVVDWNKLPPWKYDPSPAIRPSNLPPLYAYSRLPGARAILRGTIHQGSDIFSQLIRNQQTAANCVVALGMSVVKSPVTWTAKSLDEILVIGKNVYGETKKAWPTRMKIKPKDIIRVFYVGVNVLTADIEEGTVSGLVANEPPKPEIKGKKGKKGARAKRTLKRGKKGKAKVKRERAPPPPPTMLEEGLAQFFEKNRAGILVIGRYAVAIWKDNGVYFIYDPRSRNEYGLRDDHGTSCVMWFACLEPLREVIISNLDDQEKYGPYSVDRVIIKTTIIEPLPCPAGFRPIRMESVPPIPVFDVNPVTISEVETLSEYVFVEDGFRILRGNSHLEDYSFAVQSRGFQSTAIAAVAIVMSLLHVPSTWTAELLDAVIKYGDLLHGDSVRVFRPGARLLSPSELLTVFVVGDVRARISVHAHTVAGLLHIYDLTEGLTLFFRNNCAGILHLANIAVAVMQHYGKFYLVDPYPRDESGRSTLGGTSCVMKCDTVAKIAETFVANCNYKRVTVYTLNAVNILSVHYLSNTANECPNRCSK